MREQRDVSQSDVAEAIGVSAAAVSQWESGAKSPREAAVTKLAAYLGVTPAYLRYGITSDPPAVRGKLSPAEVAAAVARDKARSGAPAVPVRRTGQR